MKISRADWLVPGALLLLCFVPALAGTVRLVGLAAGGPITPETARFFDAPGPVVLHIVSAVIYSILGAFQFSPGLRRSRPRWHRYAGRILVPLGLVSALTGIWMAQFYPHVAVDGWAVYWFRMIFGVGMVAAIILGFAAIRRRDFQRHRAWMIRAYAIGLGAGMQAVLGGPLLLLYGSTGEVVRALYMGGGWTLNLLIAEWIIRTQPNWSRPFASKQASVAA